MATPTDSGHPPRRSRTKSLIGTLVATALLFGAVQALSPASAAAMIRQESQQECEADGGWWVSWVDNGVCFRPGEESGGSGSSGGGSSGSGDGGSSGGGSGGGAEIIEIIPVPIDWDTSPDDVLRELLEDPDLMPEWREQIEKVWGIRHPTIYPEDPNAFDPQRRPPRPPTVTAREDNQAPPQPGAATRSGSTKQKASQKRVRKGKAKARH